MSSNWIKRKWSPTPTIVTDDELSHVTSSHISLFFTRLQTEFLNGSQRSSGPLPQDLYDEACACKPEGLAEALRKLAAEGTIMDSGWLEDYFEICAHISESLSGYPKACLAQWRSIRDAIAGRLTTRPRNDSKVDTKNKHDAHEKPPFRFLELPEHIRQKIYALVIPTGTLIVSDWAIASNPDSVKKRTGYDVPVADGEVRRTNYLIHSNLPRDSIQLNLMLANRIVYRETASILYTSTFEFRGTASGTLAFLHDHMKVISQIRRVSMRYTTTSKTPFLGCTFVDKKPPQTIKTDLDVWRRILNMLIQSATGLEDFELVVDKHFWEQAPWTKGVRAVMSAQALCNPTLAERKAKSGAKMRNFLVDVSKLSGINLLLAIDGVGGDPEKAKFVRELHKEICRHMRAMPYVAKRSEGCSCPKRLLSETCAWEPEGERKRRRTEY